jgi:putative membrane protein
MRERDEGWKNVVAGAIGGLAGSWVMCEFMDLQQKAVRRTRQAAESRREETTQYKAALGQQRFVRELPQHDRQQRVQPRAEASQEQPTVKLAKVISEKVFRRKLNERQGKVAGPAVHYAFGTLMGAWYGVLAQLMPASISGFGTLYGTAVWLGADEIALPALRLSSSPFEHPLSQHAGALAAHAVYGASLELVRRGLLTAISSEEPREDRAPLRRSRPRVA